MRERTALDNGAHTLPRLSEIPDPLDLGPPTSSHLAIYPIGTRRIHADGRINVKTADGWRPEARVVLEREIGRPLEHNEEARKRKGVKPWDNRPAGLQLWRDGHPSRTPRRRQGPPRPRRAWKGEAIAAAEAATVIYSCYLIAAGIMRAPTPADPAAAVAADPAAP